MRVNPNPLPDLLAALDLGQKQINSDLGEIASGESVNVPSDDPAAAAGLVLNADQTSGADQYLRSIGSIQGEMQNADSALNSVVTALQRAISLGTEGANGTLNSSDQQALAVEVQGIQSELLNLANLSYQGNYVFAGTATQTAPYVAGAGGIQYVGNAGANQVSIGDHLTLQTNLPGSELFSHSGNNVFQALQDLITGLQSGSGIDTAVNEVSNAYDYVNAQRVFFGNAMNQLNSQQQFLNSETAQLAEQQNTLGGTDMTKVISDLVSAETSRQATLEAVAKTQQANLFDYIR
jgi:flagellar hook-associated protein 3 FlgL